MKVKCLILDHDDTLVDSTATVHYPCFVEYLKKYHPEAVSRYTLEEYFRKNFKPGVVELFRDELGFDEAEFLFEQEYWANYVKGHIPAPVVGMRELLWDAKRAGILLTVDSHSLETYIRRDFAAAGFPEPDTVYGWDIPPKTRKPAPDTVLDILKRYHLQKDEVLVVDDLKPGYDMACAAGVPFAAAGWCYDIPEIASFMRENANYYCQTVDDLRAVLKL